MTNLEKYNEKVGAIMDKWGITDAEKRAKANDIFLQQYATTGGTPEQQLASLDRVDREYVLNIVNGTHEYKVINGKFIDVPPTHWAKEAVENVTNKGYLKGRTDDTFDGNAPITRYEFAAVLNRLMEGK